MQFSKLNSDVVSSLEGVHLFHFGLSSCSQRVRFALAEKSIPWISHHIDLDKMEHLSDEYQAINPNGYVPTLVHQGKVVVESINIIKYLEAQFDGTPLLPLEASSESGVALISKWLARTDENQRALKTLTYQFLFKSHGHFQDQEDVRFYAEHQHNADLVKFVQDFHQGFSEQRIEENLNLANQFLSDLNEDLTHGPFIAGPNFSLADIAAVVNVHRYKLCNLPMGENDHLQDWYERVSARPAFATSIAKWS